MRLQQKKILYLPEEQKISLIKKCGDNDIIIKADIFILADKFVDYQKDIISDCLGTLEEELSKEDLDNKKVKKIFEQELQNLNSKLSVYADKIKTTKKFHIKGIIHIFEDQNYMASLIGDVSVLILRNNKVYYSLSNGNDELAKIDLFSDFIEGEVQVNDEIITIGTNLNTVIDQDDIKELSEILRAENDNHLDFMNELILTRIGEDQLGFLIAEKISYQGGERKSAKEGGSNQKITRDLKNTLIKNKLSIIITSFTLLALFLLYNLFQNFSSINTGGAIINGSGAIIDISIEEIKKEIAIFQKLDSASDDKIQKYQDIMDNLTLLEKNNKRPNDVVELKKILNIEYSKGFNIIVLNDLSADQIISFNDQEIQGLGTPTSIVFDRNPSVGGTNGALLSIVNNDIRGSLVRFGLQTALDECTNNISKNGLYCFSNAGLIYNITRSGIEPVTNKVGSFPAIEKLGTYGKGNLYVLTNDPSYTSSGAYIIRYQNNLGSQASFQEGTNNTIQADILSGGLSIKSGFSSFAIDSTFLGRSKADKKLYQFRRDGASTQLSARSIKLLGGDKIGEQYSDSIKVLSYLNINFVYLFDKKNQSFTIYKSNPVKSNDRFTTNYNLEYVMRIKFDLGQNTKIIDATIGQQGERQELLVLSNKGVAKIKLYEFLDTLAPVK
ncbi:MAG TPA: hypothetical protein PKD96_01440 [Candidatus Absconditabacterales bacterium]|nr:hypothetical protein [Candidatus Absconditabacterales bacterium]